MQTLQLFRKLKLSMYILPEHKTNVMLKKQLPLLSLTLGFSVLLNAQERTLSFEDLVLEPNTNLFMFHAETPDDGDTLIISYDQEEEIKVTLHSNIEYGYLSGFEVSNVKDETYIDYNFPLSVQPFQGANETDNYAVGFVNTDFMGPDPSATIPIEADFSNIPENYQLDHLYITNAAIAYNYILDTYPGQDFYFDIIIRGYHNEELVDSVVFNLADYRNNLNFVVEDWEMIDLSSFEEVNRLTFDLEGNDMSEYGINTPTYFGLDEISFKYIDEGVNLNELANQNLKVYPNPTNSKLFFSDDVYHLTLVNQVGQVIIQTEKADTLDLTHLDTGIYFISFELSNGKKVNRTIQKQ